jgi:hypothetical protein
VSLLAQVVKIREQTLAVKIREQTLAVKIREQTLAEDYSSRLTSQHALAIVYEANGQVKEAMLLLE